MTELTFALLKYGFLVLLWVFVWFAVRSLHGDIASFSPKSSRARRRRERAAKRAAAAPVPQVEPRQPVPVPEPQQHDQQRRNPSAAAGRRADADANAAPTLLVVVDGPLAGATIPLSGETITIGRAASNTVVLNDEFVSGHHARVYTDPASGQWAIEDLGSMNGTVVAGRRIDAPTLLPARVPVRIGATTLELR